MDVIIARDFLRRLMAAVAVMATACMLASCAQVELAPHLRPLSKDTMMLLGKKGMDPQAPIFVRVFKEESELEVWKQRSDGHFYHFKTYPICNWSGDLGPKVKQGDRQAPEGFYTVARDQMNPDSKYHLAFNLGFPNVYDRAQGRTGDYLMIHGKCKSAGCYAMTDALMEEIYAIARESFLGGNDTFQVHAFPFRMTEANMKRHQNHEAYAFWATLKEGYDYFEVSRQLPTVAVCSKRYVVNVAMKNNADPKSLNPLAACPTFMKPTPTPFTPKPGEQMAEQQVVVPGPKMRGLASAETGKVLDETQRSGLTQAPRRQTSGMSFWQQN
jgi:murein L,D-transpeptidase YafK